MVLIVQESRVSLSTVGGANDSAPPARKDIAIELGGQSHDSARSRRLDTVRWPDHASRVAATTVRPLSPHRCTMEGGCWAMRDRPRDVRGQMTSEELEELTQPSFTIHACVAVRTLHTTHHRRDEDHGRSSPKTGAAKAKGGEQRGAMQWSITRR